MPAQPKYSNDVLTLAKVLYAISGWSYREIARTTGIRTETIMRWGRVGNWVDAREEFLAARQQGRMSDAELKEKVATLAAGECDPKHEDKRKALVDAFDLIFDGHQMRTEPAPKDEPLFGEPIPGVAEPVTEKMLESVEEFLSDAQQVNERHFQLYEAFHVLIRDRLGIRADGTMEDPGVHLLPGSEIKELLHCVRTIQDGQRKALGIDKGEAVGNEDILIEYENLRSQHGDEATRLKVQGESMSASEAARQIIDGAPPTDPNTGAQVEFIDVSAVTGGKGRHAVTRFDPATVRAIEQIPEIDEAEKPRDLNCGDTGNFSGPNNTTIEVLQFYEKSDRTKVLTLAIGDKGYHVTHKSLTARTNEMASEHGGKPYEWAGVVRTLFGIEVAAGNPSRERAKNAKSQSNNRLDRLSGR